MKNKFYLGVIAVLVVIILVLFTCNKCGKSRPVKGGKDTVSVKTKIVIEKVHDTITTYVPVIKNIYVPKTVTRTRLDSFITYLPKDVDTTAMLKDYYSVVVYEDKRQTRFGAMTINDTLSRNRVLARGITTDFSIPTVIKEITLVQPKRRILYLGFSMQGNQKDLLHAAGADLSFKVKNDRVYIVGANYTFNGDLFYEAGIKFPIKIRGR